jgi:hypothetical protein
MAQNERHIIIDDLFDRLRKAEEQTQPRDPDPLVSTAAGLTISCTVPSSSERFRMRRRMQRLDHTVVYRDWRSNYRFGRIASAASIQP